jgi:hypothetical protein
MYRLSDVATIPVCALDKFPDLFCSLGIYVRLPRIRAVIDVALEPITFPFKPWLSRHWLLESTVTIPLLKRFGCIVACSGALNDIFSALSPFLAALSPEVSVVVLIIKYYI